MGWVSHEELKYGEEGEQMVARWLIRNGHLVNPLYQHDTKSAPLIFGLSADVIAPDMLVLLSGGRTIFVECKRKRSWVSETASNDFTKETGFGVKNWRSYLALDKAIDPDLWIFFIHEKQEPTGLFVARVSDLKRKVRIWDGRHFDTGEQINEPLALFPWHALVKRAELQELQELGDGHQPRLPYWVDGAVNERA